MTPTITIKTDAQTINEAFGVTDDRVKELMGSLIAVQDGFKTVLDGIMYLRTICANNQEFAFMMWAMNPGPA